MTIEAASPAAMDYLLFDPAPFGFPPPSLPVLPPMRWSALRLRQDPERATPAWEGNGRLYSRSRYALHDAYRLSGVGPQGTLLAPAYHCRTMLDPALALGAPVRLYAVHADLRIDLSDIDNQLASAGVPVKAVLAPHFFGMSQDLQPLASVCRSRGAALVEDCAHALPLRSPSNGMGMTGALCVASPYKFFPCEDGGALWRGSGQPMALAALRRPGLRAQMGQLRSMHRKTRQHVPSPRAELPANGAGRGLSPHSPIGPVRLAGASTDYNADREGLACSALSGWIIGHSDPATIIMRRRANYLRWVQAAAAWGHARAWRTELGPNDTPYMFPLLLERPQDHFAALKYAGLPIWRWDNLAASQCRTSAYYRLHLLQLPCHQSLSEAELDWMINTLGRVLKTTPAGAVT